MLINLGVSRETRYSMDRFEVEFSMLSVMKKKRIFFLFGNSEKEFHLFAEDALGYAAGTIQSSISGSFYSLFSLGH